MWLTPAVKAVETETEPGPGLGLGLEVEPGAEVEAEPAPGCPDPQPIVTKSTAIMLIKNDLRNIVSSADTRAQSKHTSGSERRHPESYLGEIL
jgi:hypothetical protein